MSVHRLLELLNNRERSFSVRGEEEIRFPDRYRRKGFATC